MVQVTQAVGYVGPSTHHGFDHTAMAADIAARVPFLRRVFTYEAPGTSSPYGGLTTDPAGCQYSSLGALDAAPEPPLAQRADQVAFLLPGGTAELRLVPRTHNDYAYQARAAAESNLTFGSPGIVGTLSAGGTRRRPALARRASQRPGVQLGGATGDRALAERTGPALGCRSQQVFGTAEGLLVLTRPDETVPTTQGRPLSPDDEIRLVGPDGKDVPDGQPGELLVRGPCTPRGYYRAPDHNARSFTADGYFRTGALARRTPDDNLVVTGRIKV
ncbi:AMP-binding protein [Streptomyces sp. NPDC054838]